MLRSCPFWQRKLSVNDRLGEMLTQGDARCEGSVLDEDRHRAQIDPAMWNHDAF